MRPLVEDRYAARGRVAGGLIRAVLPQPFQQRFERHVRFEVIVLQRVRGIDAAAIDTGADQHQCLIEVGGELALVLALPIAGEIERRGAGEDLLQLATPATLLKVIRRGNGAAQEFL